MNHSVVLFLTATLLMVSAQVTAQPVDPRELIRDARTAARQHGDQVWAGYNDAPFGVLLVEESGERLFCHQPVPEEFESTGLDPVLSCPSGVRPTTFPLGMLASFPAVAGIPTIVIGTPEATKLSPDAWVLTLLHEHFHQLQYSWPGYYPGTAGLGLDDEDDDSGMWMLNYPFPYEHDATVSAFRAMADALTIAINARDSDGFDDALISYWRSREAARQSVSEADWRYVEFQYWQEGVARWTEGAIASRSDRLSEAAAEAHARILRELAALDLSKHKRSVFYPLGAGEAMLLEAGGSGWRDNYWSEPFSLGPQLQNLVETSR